MQKKKFWPKSEGRVTANYHFPSFLSSSRKSCDSSEGAELRAAEREAPLLLHLVCLTVQVYVRACELPSVCLARVTITPRAKIHTRDSDALCERMGIKYTRHLLPSLQLLSWRVGGRRLTGLEVLTSAKNEACPHTHTHTHAIEVQQRCSLI